MPPAPFLSLWKYVKALKPSILTNSPHYNFMSMHYLWIIFLGILGSICVFPNGKIKYIDALFLACGAATQSGLNTVNLNELTTWQQLVFYFGAMLGNPITINSFVVILRLYWFEKEFQEVAKQANKGRRTMSFSKTFTRAMTVDRDLDIEERGVGNRDIVVMHGGDGRNGNGIGNGAAEVDQLNKRDPEATRSSTESITKNSTGQSSSTAEAPNAVNTPQQPQIKFADQVKRSNGMKDGRLSTPVDANEHIAILQRQRNPENTAVLRIPGPRDADAGFSPEEVDANEVLLSQTLSRNSAFNGSENGAGKDESHPHPPKRNITIQEPDRKPNTPVNHVIEDANAAKSVFSSLGGLNRRQRKDSAATHKSDPHVPRERSGTLNKVRTFLTQDKDKDDGVPYLSWQPTVGRNSVFVDLSEEQREELGGVEYRSLKSLAKILILYNVGFNSLAFIGLIPWILRNPAYGKVVTDAGQGRVWWGFFTAGSAFADLGFTLTPDSMVSFQSASWPLFFMSFLIIIGNTGFPIMLRVIIWCTSKWVPAGSGIYEETKFLLDHPRRCFTLLFPSVATWWLLGILVVLNAVDLIFFIILDLGNSVVTDLPVRIRILDGWFQAVSTRTAGFAVVDLSKLHPAIQVSYLVMMYISVLPIAISVRRTNVYEEKSLGLYGSPAEETEEEDTKQPSYVGSHLRRQLSFDLWYIFLGFFIICIAEGSKIMDNTNFTMFGILFEIVSAYGTVGLSLGFPDTFTSLSAQFTVISKLVIIAMQIRGRHRGLPYALDKAIMLPSSRLEDAEQAEAEERTRRRSSFGSHVTSVTGFPPMEPEQSRAPSIQGLTRRHTRVQVAGNLLGNLMHIGPALPESHRQALRRQPTERHRTGSIPEPTSRGRKARSVSPRHMSGSYGIALDDVTSPATTTGPAQRKRAVSGRRKFDPNDPAEPALHDDSASQHTPTIP